MKVLAIGGRGQFGQDFVSLAQADAAVSTVSQINRPEIDLACPDRIETSLDTQEFDVLLNFAAEHKTDEVETDPRRAFAVNAHAVRQLAELCKRRGAVLYQVSTDYVFGGDWRRKAPYVEADPLAPVNAYGASKAVGEALARLAHDRVVVVRVASLFGLGSDGPPRGNFVETMLRLAEGGKPLKVVADQEMSPTSTVDAARALLGLVTRGTDAGTFHAVNSGSASWYDLASETFRLAGIDADLTPVPSSAYPTVAARPRYCVLDNSRIGAVTEPMPEWRDALGRYLDARRRPAEAVA